MITTIGCCIVVWVLMVIWHWYRCQKLEDDIKTACKRIVELDEENTMLRDAMQFCSGSCRVSTAILETRRVSEDYPD